MSPEDAFNNSILTLVINPYADRLEKILTDIFTELNLQGVKDLKEAKKQKRFAIRKTPLKRR